MPEKPVRSTSRAPRVSAVPRERLNFRRLIAANPNYFGNLAESSYKSVKKIQFDTTFEEVTCLGYNPALDLLEATVQIKLPTGYNGAICFAGSTEYVRFYVDYGSGWIDVGPSLTSFNVHDIPNKPDCADAPDKPLSYVLTQPLNPPRNFCFFAELPKVRAILSWNNPPPAGQPNWIPIWGNVIDRYIQIQPRPLFLGDLVKHLPADALEKLPDLSNIPPEFPIPLPGPGPVELAELVHLYQGKPGGRAAAQAQVVPAHRFGLSSIQAVLAQGSQMELAQLADQWKGLEIDLSKAIAALEETQADVSFEELDCLGLEYNLDRLVATIKIKRPNGYSGDLCTLGSQEYVAFWADWNNTCEWTYLNTVQVNVHDISTIPADGLCYSAILPVDTSPYRQACQKGPKEARIRAVLSWNTPPSTVDPNALNTWGNLLDAHVQLRPGDPVIPGTPMISIIGGIGIADINVFGNGMTKPTATFAFGGSAADPWGLNRECPFGQLIIVQGPPVLFQEYRLWARLKSQPLTEQVVKNPFHVVNWLGVGSWITPNPVTGFVSYMDTLSNMDQVLAHWTPGGDDTWEIRMEMTTMGGPIFTSWYTIQLDNTAPRRKPPTPPFEPPDVTCEIHIDSGGDCKDFGGGTMITGHFTARDTNFGAFSLETLPSSMLPPNPTTPTPSTTQTTTFALGGDPWTLNTSNMKPCGYVVLLQVWDRSILNSVPGQHNYNFYDVGFCLRE
ncbi:MAG: hypothetical protein ACM3PY_10155 [Omnitrophica WOR_2 bacterium]